MKFNYLIHKKLNFIFQISKIFAVMGIDSKYFNNILYFNKKNLNYILKIPKYTE